MSEFVDKVYSVVSKIPRGKTMAYKEVAAAAGKPRAARAVGTILNKNPRPGTGKGKIPCHRVVRSDGSPGGYAFGPRKKRELLRQEGALR